MNWRKWKIGLGLAFAGGICDALSIYVVDDAPKWGKVAALAVAKGLVLAGAYMKTHPVDDINFDTQTIKKPKE